MQKALSMEIKEKQRRMENMQNNVQKFDIYWWVDTFLKAANSGSLLHACLSAFALLYMVSTWGGYVFIINMIPLWVIALLILGKCDNKVYVAYSIFYVLGTLLSL